MASSQRDESPRRLNLRDARKASGEQWSAFLGGDSLLHAEYADAPFGAALRERMQGADLSLVNLEAPIEGIGEPLTKSGPINHTTPETPEVFAEAGIDAVTLANNHAMDRGAEALLATIDACADAGIDTCGAGTTAADALEPITCDVGEGTVRVGVIGVCEQEYGIADGEAAGTAWVNHPDALDRIEATARETDVLIVGVHAGIEYAPLPPDAIRERVRSIVDVGADLVVGHHPHVPQGWERVDGVPVFYSLGNFLFEQSHRPNTQRGLALEVEFRGETPVGIDLIPTELASGGVREMPTNEDQAELLGHLHRSARIIGDDDAHAAHWQEIADRIFLQRHAHLLRGVAGGDPLRMLRHPLLHLRQGGLWNAEHRQTEMLTLLNLVRNESHEAVIETALELRAGVVTDRRTPEVQETVRELFARTEDSRVYDPPSTPRRSVRSLIDRLGRKLELRLPWISEIR